MLLSVGHCGRLSTLEVAAQEREEREEAEEECAENDADACALLSRHYHTGYGGLTRDDAAAVRLASGATRAVSWAAHGWASSSTRAMVWSRTVRPPEDSMNAAALETTHGAATI